MKNKSIDPEVLANYNAGIEKDRLHTGLGLIEFARTCEILAETLPPPPAVIYDIGGGYGEYAWWLSSLGYEVHLFDLSKTNIEMSAALAAKYPHAHLHSAEVADARQILRPDASADAILLMGPLYHILEYKERQEALNECRRLLRPEGVLFCAGITRYATILWAITSFGKGNNLLADADFMNMVKRELTDGQHIKTADSAYAGMGRSFFTLPEELTCEIEAAGFYNADVRGIIGPLWLVPGLDAQWKDKARREHILNTVRLLEKEKDIMGVSTHLLAIAKN